MRNRLFVFSVFTASISFALFFSCATATNHQAVNKNETDSRISNPSPLNKIPFDLRPIDGELIIIGVDSPRATLEESIDFAQKDAARKAAFYHNLEGTVSVVLEEGNGFFDFYADKLIALTDEPDYSVYIESMKFDKDSDVIVDNDNNAIYVRCRYKPGIPLKIIFSYMNNGSGRPDWVTSPPHTISGYTAGVGFANAHDWHRKTVIKSYEDAAGVILLKQYGVISSDIDAGNSTTEIIVHLSDSYIVKGSITGFYVLDTWTDPVDKSVWTLAIANEK